MKKLSIILLAILLTVSLFVSCDNSPNMLADEHVKVTFSVDSGSRGLGYSIESIPDSNLQWYYSAVKSDPNDQFRFGEVSNEEVTLGDELTFSQGLWNFTLYAKRIDVEGNPIVYYGTSLNVLITHADSPVPIYIQVSSSTGATGTLVLNNVSINKYAESGTPESPSVKANKADIKNSAGEPIITLDLGTDPTSYPLAAGNYSVIVKYLNSYGEVVNASEEIFITVWSGRTTTISGSIDEITGSGTIGAYYTETITNTIDKNTIPVFDANVAPANNETTSENSTTVAFNAGKLVATDDSKTVSLEVSVKDIEAAGSDSTFTVEGNQSAVAGISLNLKVGEEEKTGEFGDAVITTYIVKGLTSVSVKYNGTDYTTEPGEIQVINQGETPNDVNNYYESYTGKLVFTTNHFSEYYVVSNSVDALNVTTNTAYATLADAINAVPVNANETTNILILRDVANAEGLSVASGKNFVVDFNGHTYTIVGPGAGSTNTETNGFQFLRNSTITLKNGKINLSKSNRDVLRVIQNYANLTLEDLEIDATNQYDYKDYVISFCCGNNKIIGNTSIYSNASSFNPDKSVIFDVYDWADGGYHGVNLTIDTTGDIRGVVEIDLAEQGDECGSYFKLTNGNVNKVSITGGIINNLNEINTPNIVITGGQFSTDPSQYVDAYYTAVANDGNTSWTVRKMNYEELANAGYVARYYESSYYKSITEAFSNYGSGIHLINNAQGAISRTGYVQLYCDDYTFEGTISCTPTPNTSGNVSIYTGTAILNNIECSSTFYCGSSSNSPTITIKDGSINNLEARKNAKVIIEGGTYTGTITLNTGGNGSLTIKGGTFSADPTIYVPEGYAATFNGQTWEVSEQSN